MIDPIEFRRVMGHFATGVTVVTTRLPSGEPCGLTASAVCSVSIDPTLILVCVEHRADSHDCIREAGIFAVNILEEDGGENISRRFATLEVADKFRGVAFREERTGAPVLDSSLAWLDCRVSEVLPGGDHTIFLGEVVA
ncbi:MAG: flavin reductase family protein, partial [Gemmatimonadetes bacterium]|nr:flavin reductase family protein [Gemmatimonadota bacterium]